MEEKTAQCGGLQPGLQPDSLATLTLSFPRDLPLGKSLYLKAFICKMEMIMILQNMTLRIKLVNTSKAL